MAVFEAECRSEDIFDRVSGLQYNTGVLIEYAKLPPGNDVPLR